MLTTNDTAVLFESAARVFRAAPSPDSLTILTSAARLMSEGKADASFFTRLVRAASPVATATAWVKPTDHPGDWQEVRATFDRLLTVEEAQEAAGAIGYALRIYFNGEELSDPTYLLDGLKNGDAHAVLQFAYDSTKAIRSEPDTAEAFEEALRYIKEGSPVRQTNRAGVKTKGTRLVKGVGPVGVTFEVR